MNYITFRPTMLTTIRRTPAPLTVPIIDTHHTTNGRNRTTRVIVPLTRTRTRTISFFISSITIRRVMIRPTHFSFRPILFILCMRTTRVWIVINIELFVITRIFRLHTRQHPFIGISRKRRTRTTHHRMSPFVITTSLVKHERAINARLTPSPRPTMITISLSVKVHTFFHGQSFLLLRKHHLFREPFQNN